MSNELSAARGIGASISKSTGSIPTLKFKKTKEEKEAPSAKTTSTSSKPKQEKEPKAPKAPKAPKQGRAKKETKQGPIKVESTVVGSRPNRPGRTPAGELTAPPRELPGGQRWEEFKSYVEANKSGKMSPPINLD